MISGPSGNVHDPQKALFMTLDHQVTQNNSRKIRNHLKTIYLGKFHNLKNRKMEKTRAGKSLSPSYKFLKILKMG